MDKAHNVENVAISGKILSIRVDGTDHKFDIFNISDRLAKASPEQRSNFVVSPSGYGIHWPDVDEDLSIDGLIGVKHPSPIGLKV